MSLSHTQLKRWYRHYNRKWFDGRLPDDMDVFYAPDDHNHGLATREITDERAIKVDTTVAGTRYAKLILLHEMNHHFTGDFNHGSRFEAGMLRLAVLGALRNIW